MSRAFYIHGPRDVRVAPFNLRPGKPDEVLLEVSAVGLCGSDLHYYKDGGIGSAMIEEPFVPGHEFGGRLADDLPELGLASGTLVAVDPNNACGHCAHCREGYPNLCPNVEFIGAPPFDGAMTERLWVPKGSVVPVPEAFTAIDAVMLEPLGVAIHAVGLAKPRLMERVALLGCGPIGLLILQVLRVAGAGEILAVDPLPHRRDAAARLGASRIGASVTEMPNLDQRRGCTPRRRSHQLTGRLARCGAGGADRRAGCPRRHSGWWHLYPAGRGSAAARAQDQVRPAHGRGLSAGDRARRLRQGRCGFRRDPHLPAREDARSLPASCGGCARMLKSIILPNR